MPVCHARLADPCEKRGPKTPFPYHFNSPHFNSSPAVQDHFPHSTHPIVLSAPILLNMAAGDAAQHALPFPNQAADFLRTGVSQAVQRRLFPARDWSPEYLSQSMPMGGLGWRHSLGRHPEVSRDQWWMGCVLRGAYNRLCCRPRPCRPPWMRGGIPHSPFCIHWRDLDVGHTGESIPHNGLRVVIRPHSCIDCLGHKTTFREITSCDSHVDAMRGRPRMASAEG